jgi:cytochrome c biogenesis protein CcdA
MLVLLVLVVSVAAVDSLNPSTLGPALLFAVGKSARRQVATFTLGVFCTSTASGLVLVFGPGRALLSFASKPSPHTVHLVEVATGAALLAVAAGLWVARERVARKLRKQQEQAGRSAFLLGAGIVAAELPTAFPYLGALTATVEAHRGAAAEIGVVLLYNLCFVLPLLVLLAGVVAGGTRGAQLARAARRAIEQYGAVVVPLALATIGAVILALGLTGVWS